MNTYNLTDSKQKQWHGAQAAVVLEDVSRLHRHATLKKTVSLTIGEDSANSAIVRVWVFCSRQSAQQTVAWFRDELGDLPYHIHKPEGAMIPSRRAKSSTLFNYPVPQHMGRAQCEELLHCLLENSALSAVDSHAEALLAA